MRAAHHHLLFVVVVNTLHTHLCGHKSKNFAAVEKEIEDAYWTLGGEKFETIFVRFAFCCLSPLVIDVICEWISVEDKVLKYATAIIKYNSARTYVKNVRKTSCSRDLPLGIRKWLTSQSTR